MRIAFVGKYFFCWQILCSDDILCSKLCKYIIKNNIEDLWLTIVDKWLICVCVRTLLFIYMSKMSGRDHENLTTN